MREKTLLVVSLLLWASVSHAEMGFDQRYERDYNIFNPANQYASDNPLNPANRYNPGAPFAPLDGEGGPRKLR